MAGFMQDQISSSPSPKDVAARSSYWTILLLHNVAININSTYMVTTTTSLKRGKIKLHIYMLQVIAIKNNTKLQSITFEASDRPRNRSR